MNRFFIVAALATLALTGVANADALSDLVQMRTAKFGETCRQPTPTIAGCTMFKSTDYQAIYFVNPVFNKYQIRDMSAETYCAMAAKSYGQEIYVASFFKHQGEVILNCVLRKM